ncbi:dihydropteroate synthase [Demequina sp. SYSU T00039]|uniref:Dihydropteroate synthase n=1 Tax=Demequina lignilytica TaxID=3051663 RepID=A0AAW7M5F9_9MICO|nr:MULTISPECIES: dihydropteroate synthase [unclassified Demequina]MDN4477466.1 dihydropteroate synthase [Demequina sp. SYSU T00039-1]MDN4488183.1 dihydropteroate synthase [Demequina sp. SYSU T00039]
MTLVMGILNVTPDSFSDGGRFARVDDAVAQGVALVAGGADLVDVGGESTRPGAAPVTPEEERARVIPVIRELADRGIVTSIDTMHAATARAAVEAGASLVNDVSGGLADAAMAATVADLEVDFICMHWRAHSPDMDALDRYDDVVAEVRDELAARVDALVAAGVGEQRIVLDPGLGFSKVTDSNWPLLARVDDWSRGHRVLIGASRKRFLGAAIARDGVDAADPAVREHATTAVTALAARAGAWAVRVHDATAAADAVRVVSAWNNAARREG